MSIVGANRSGIASGGGEMPSQVRPTAIRSAIASAPTMPQTSSAATMPSQRFAFTDASRGPAIKARRAGGAAVMACLVSLDGS